MPIVSASPSHLVPALGHRPDRLPVLDEAAFLATQLVMSTHRDGWRDLQDSLLVYEWIQASATTVAALPAIYPTPRQAAMYLHALRLKTDRDVICEDFRCPGGSAGPREIEHLTGGPDAPQVDALAAATVRFIVAYHQNTPLRHAFLVYYWVRQTQQLEALADTGHETGAARNAARVDYASGAVDLLHRLADRSGPCEACEHQRATGLSGADTSLEALESWYAAGESREQA